MQEPRQIHTEQAATSNQTNRKIRRPDEQKTADSKRKNTTSQNGKKPKKKMRWWVPLLVVVCVLGIAAGAVIGYASHVLNSIAPGADTPPIAEEVQTAPEFKGDVVNILLVGMSFDDEHSHKTMENGDKVGLTDMIMYINYDLKNNKINMLQIPRNTLVGKTVTCENLQSKKTYKTTNGQINTLAYANPEGFPALADVIANNYRLPVDYYASIDTQALKEVVDMFGGIEVYVPQDITDKYGNTIKEGYQLLNGERLEFVLRQRKGYANGDLTRLNVQRYFYAALFQRIRTATLVDMIKLVPVMQQYLKTNIPTKDLVALAYKFLSIRSSDIMVAQTPVCGSSKLFWPNPDKNFKGHSVVVPARQEIADLLNQYYRAYTEPFGPEDLSLYDDWPSNGTPSNPNVQFMGQLDAEVAQAGGPTAQPQEDVPADGEPDSGDAADHAA